MDSRLGVIILAIYLAGLTGCYLGSTNSAAPTKGRKALTVFPGPNVTGRLELTQTGPDEKVHVTGSVKGLNPGTHGFHVHEFGDTSGEGCLAAGPHYNPLNFTHAGPADRERHEGDLGNIGVDGNGVAKIDVYDHVITLYGKYSILSRSFVVHAKTDDLGRGGNAESLKTGNAGARLGCGIIGLIKEDQNSTTGCA